MGKVNAHDYADYNHKNEPYIEAIYRINSKQKLGKELAYKAFLSILNMQDGVSHRDSIMASFLTGLLCNDASIDEIVSIIQAIIDFEGSNFNEQKVKVFTKGKLVSILGSGKKGLKTFNISTSAALVASTCGANVVKIGSSSTSSLSGSRDILGFLGANLDIDRSIMIKIIQDLGFGFFPIEGIIPKFDKIYGGKFYAPHILSYILPALVSPVYLDGIVYGLAGKNIKKSADLLEYYGFKSFSVVSSTEDNIHFIDEISGFSKTKIIRKYNQNDYTLSIDPLSDLGLPHCLYEDIRQGETIQDNAQMLLNGISLSGDMNKNNIIAVNASELLCVSGVVENMKEGYEKSITAIKENKPIKLLKDFIEYTGGEVRKNLSYND